MQGLKKLECYITLSLNGMSNTNTLAYWVHSQNIKKMNCCEYGPWCIKFVYLLSKQNKIMKKKIKGNNNFIKLGKFVKEKIAIGC
jgi:hypothetical protein